MITKKKIDPTSKKVLHWYFKGLAQKDIAGKCGVSQPTVSRCQKEFTKIALAFGIEKAIKEYGIVSIVEELRDLAVQLYKADIDVAEAKAGAEMVTTFDEYGVLPTDYPKLAKAFVEVQQPDFAVAAVKLIKLEESTGKEYSETIAEYQEVIKKVDEEKQALAGILNQKEQEAKALDEKKKDRQQQELDLTAFLENAKKQKIEAQKEVDGLLANAALTKEQLDTVHEAVTAAHQQGIKDKDLVAYVQERLQLKELGLTGVSFTHVAKALVQAGELYNEGLADDLQQYGSLQNSVHALTVKQSALQEEIKTLSKNKLKYEKNLKDVKAHIDSASKTNEQLEKKRHDLSTTVTQLVEEKNTLEKELPILQVETVERTGQLTGIGLQIIGMSDKLVGLNQKVADSEAKVKAAGQDYMVFEALRDMAKKAEGSGLANIADEFEAVLKAARVVAKDPGAFLASLISRQTGGPINIVECNNCGARMIIVKQGTVDQQSIQSPTTCPDCSQAALGTLETVISTGGMTSNFIVAKPVQKPDLNQGTVD